jgi:hypothetical protein
MRALAAGLALSCVVLAPRAPAQGAEPSFDRTWSGNHAPTIPRGRVELGLFQSSHYGLTDRIELSLHPILFFALPHVEAKVQAQQHGRLSWGVRGRLAYPTLFLGLISRSGAGGLLPETSSPPQALQIEGDLLGSVVWTDSQLASAALGLAVAPHTSFTPQELPLLDFPFLYPRFAPLYSVLVPRMALAFEGHLAWRLFYDVALSGYLMPELPDVGTAYALEQALALEYRHCPCFAVSAGLRASEAKYPYDTLVHFLPYLDVRFGF